MTVRRGDIVVLPFPYADRTGVKVRPALVIQNDRDNGRLQSTIVAMITSRTDRADREATQFLVAVVSEVGKESGLAQDSAVNCIGLLTVSQSLIKRHIGRLPESAMHTVDACLRAALALS